MKPTSLPMADTATGRGVKTAASRIRFVVCLPVIAGAAGQLRVCLVVMVALATACPLARAQRSVQVPDGSQTVLLSHFDEGRGSVTQDFVAATKGRQGILVGKPTWTKGLLGSALLLDGLDDAVDFGSHGDVVGAAAYSKESAGSVEFSFSPARDINGAAGSAIIVDCCQSPRVTISATGELQASYVTESWSADNVHVLKSGMTQWQAGTWYTILFTWDEKGHQLFVDGTPMASDGLTGGVLVGPHNVTVGGYFNGTVWSGHFAGTVDEMQIRRFPTAPTSQLLPSGIIRQTRQIRGTITGRFVDYSVLYPPDGSDLPVFLHLE